MKNKFTIAAKDAEQFTLIEEKVNTLPDVIKDQIEKVEMSSIGIKCIFKAAFGSSNNYVLPIGVNKINDYGDYIGIHSKDFFFTIPFQPYQDETKLKIGYSFI